MFYPNQELNERYILNEILARGGMGEVWIANDKILNRKVAIKSINLKLLEGNSGAISIFKDEAEIGSELLGHPNIVAILDYGIHVEEPNEEHYIVMEYVEGLSVARYIDTIKSKINAETYYHISLLIALEICRAIDFAHRKRILHRDIKPLNIFISKYGIIKVGDFGLARFIDAATRTHTVSNFKSSYFAAPEQWLGEDYEKNTDIYQLGCTLYQLFTGKFVFEKNQMAQMYSHLNDDVIPPDKLCKRISKELSEMILKMLSKNKNDREDCLWQLNDVLAKELQKEFVMSLEIKNKDEDIINLVAEITDFDTEELQKDEEFSLIIPDYNEILSEGLELISNEFYNFKISKEKI